MKASELIDQLQELMTIHGDVDVNSYCDAESFSIREISFEDDALWIEGELL